MPTSGSPYCLINNFISCLAIISRANRLAYDKNTGWLTFSADALKPLLLTLSPTGKEDITVNGQLVACHIFDVSPIQHKLWVSDATGDVLKVTVPIAKIEVVRDL